MGVFTTVAIEQGDTVFIDRIARDRRFGGFNHSCKPNTVLARYRGEIIPVLIRDVRPGVELTVFYHPKSKMKIKCKCSSCRRAR